MNDDNLSQPGLTRRKLKDRLMRGIAIVATIIVLLPLFDMIYIVLARGLPALSLTIFTQSTNGISGGLQNAILGSLLLMALSAAIAVPLGVFSGVHLAEYGGAFGKSVRFFADVLTGVPSIVVGYFGYITMVLYLGWGFSALAAAVALTIIMLPYIARTTEIALKKVPQEVKEGSLALGATRAATINKISIRYAAPGIITGILIAVSISLGETAPLIYTANWSNYPPALSLTHSSVGYLTYVAWAFINEPFASAQQLAYVASLLLMAFVLTLSFVARILINRWWKY